MMKALGLYTHTHTHTHTHTDILKNKKGITLVALVITIIILLILAGISIQAITHIGMFAKAKQAELENKRAQVSEYLRLKLINEQINNPFGSAEEIITATRNNVIENIEDLKKIGKEVTIGEISTEEEFKQVEVYFYVTVDGDLYKVELKGVSFVGKIDEMNPAIKIAKITNTTSTITVEVTTARNEGGKLEYYVKSEDEEEYKLIETKEEEKYTYKGLEQGKKYNVKIIAVAKNNKTAEVIGEQITGKVTELTTANAKFTYSPNGWTNTDVVAKASTDVTGFTIQTSLDGQNWSNTPSQTLSANGPVYARLWDGTNAGGMLTGNVTKIDKTAPTFTVNATSGGIGSNGAISFSNVVEKESGISGYYIGQTNPSNANINFTNTQNISINNSGIWYMAIKDKAGNISKIQSSTYYKLNLNADGATNCNSSATYIKSGTRINLPTGLVKSGYRATTWTGGINSININKDTSLSPIWSAYWDNYPYLTVTGTGYVAGSKEVTNNMMLVDFYGEYEWRNTYSYPITLHYYIDNTYKTSDGSGIIWVSPNGERSNMYFYDSATDGNTKSGTCTVPPGYVLAIHNENDVRAWYTIYVQ